MDDDEPPLEGDAAMLGDDGDRVDWLIDAPVSGGGWCELPSASQRGYEKVLARVRWVLGFDGLDAPGMSRGAVVVMVLACCWVGYGGE